MSKRSIRNHASPSSGTDSVQLSKSLSWILRHGASESGLQLDPGGYLSLDDLLALPTFSRWTTEDVRSVVATNDKKRFHLVEDERGKLRIRCNQGHTLKVEDDLLLQPIHLEDLGPLSHVIHGTNPGSWEAIRSGGRGLCRMRRNHIHFATGREEGADGIRSGIRRGATILIYVDMEAALKGKDATSMIIHYIMVIDCIDGIKFYKSANNVILSPGDEEGYLPLCYFSKVIHTASGEDLLGKYTK